MESDVGRTDGITSNAEHQLPAFENVSFRVGAIGSAEEVTLRVAPSGDIDPGGRKRGSKLYHQGVCGHLPSASMLVGDLWTHSLHPFAFETLAIPTACE